LSVREKSMSFIGIAEIFYIMHQFSSYGEILKGINIGAECIDNFLLLAKFRTARDVESVTTRWEISSETRSDGNLYH
jgi:hypothetical protein